MRGSPAKPVEGMLLDDIWRAITSFKLYSLLAKRFERLSASSRQRLGQKERQAARWYQPKA